MEGMFDGAWSFNQDISSWNVSSVADMRYMFCEADSFNQDLSAWDVTNATTVYGMFFRCSFDARRKLSWFREAMNY